MTAKFRNSHKEITSRFILYHGGFGFWVGLGMCICARTTTTRIRQHADKEHKQRDPKPWR